MAISRSATAMLSCVHNFTVYPVRAVRRFRSNKPQYTATFRTTDEPIGHRPLGT